MPLCARCAGITVGTLISFPTMYLLEPNVQLLSSLPMLLIPAAIDGFRQLFGGLSNNRLRFITGVLAGIGIVSFARLLRFLILGV